jgi:hypothetical protein
MSWYETDEDLIKNIETMQTQINRAHVSSPIGLAKPIQLVAAMQIPFPTQVICQKAFDIIKTLRMPECNASLDESDKKGYTAGLEYFNWILDDIKALEKDLVARAAEREKEKSLGGRVRRRSKSRSKSRGKSRHK